MRKCTKRAINSPHNSILDYPVELIYKLPKIIISIRGTAGLEVKSISKRAPY